MDVSFIDSISGFDAQLWNALIPTDYPFVRHEFLAALESAADVVSVGEEPFIACNAQTGWQPQHIAVYDGDELIAAVPTYLKNHSYGEYIFDWGWADAYQRNGLNYYPKLLSGIPFSPVGGPRLLLSPTANRADVFRHVAQAVQEQCEQQGLSSYHLLYLPEQDSNDLQREGLVQRHSFQYHWKNESDEERPYADFDEFLATLKSRKRKSIRKERQSVTDQQIEFEHLNGDAISDSHWVLFYELYQRTYLKRSGHGGYLPMAFFKKLGQSLPHHVLLVLAKHRGEYVAGALYLTSGDTLYGRYWGCRAHADYLHFETCIYQGMEYCIRNGISRFDAGAQGEHKLQRGFRPTSTWSNHWIQRPEFRSAIGDFIVREKEQNLAYMQQALDYLPYRCA